MIAEPDCVYCALGDIAYATYLCSGDAMAGRSTLVHKVSFQYYWVETPCQNRSAVAEHQNAQLASQRLIPQETP